jgi:LacI family transcriptional regulator
MAVTANELARIVGVSTATVSLVLNNRPGVGEETRKKILETARQLGYKKLRRFDPSAIKNISLVIYKKHGDVVSDTPFFAELIQGIEQQSRKTSYNLLIFYFYESQDYLEQLRAITRSSCQGIILLATEMNPEDLRFFSHLSVPLVILDNFFSGANIDSITINNIQGSLEAVRYLTGVGHRRIGHLRSSVGISNFYERREGFLKGLGGLPAAARAPSFSVTSTSEGAYRDMKKHLEANPEIPGAFFADNDIIAISCIRALREARYRVPEEVSVVGFDDIPASALIEPPLTTMRVPKRSMGAMAMERLIKKIEGETGETVRIELNTELVIRSSVRVIS